MTLKILSTTILDRTELDATAEVVVSDAGDLDEANEYLILRLRIPYKEGDALVNVEKETLNKAGKISDQIVDEMRQRLYSKQ